MCVQNISELNRMYLKEHAQAIDFYRSYLFYLVGRILGLATRSDSQRVRYFYRKCKRKDNAGTQHDNGNFRNKHPCTKHSFADKTSNTPVSQSGGAVTGSTKVSFPNKAANNRQTPFNSIQLATRHAPRCDCAFLVIMYPSG